MQTRSPKKGERDFSLSIGDLEVEACNDWPTFIKNATENVHFEQHLAILAHQQRHIPFAKTFIPFTGLFYNQISLYLREKTFKLSTEAFKNLISGLLQDYVEACGLTLYCIIQDEIPNRNLNSYESWTENFYRHRWPSFSKEYAVLGLLLKQRYNQYFHHCCEVFDRLEKDLPFIQETFDTKIETISSLDFRLSDRHNHGRSVCKIEINASLNIIYKPKSLKNEVWIQNLLRTNSALKESGIGQYVVLDMGEYGWSEFIQQDKNIEHSTIDFIESYSSLLALMYLINASDMHTENALACNNKVYPIDVETIFNPPVTKPEYKSNWRDYSIFFTGMLFDDLDIHLKNTDNKKHYYENKNIHIMYRVAIDKDSGVSLHIQESAKKNEERTSYKTSRLSDEEWLSFAKKIENKILHYKNSFLKDNPFTNNNLFCRYVPRNTAFYARIQQVLYHPHKLKNFKSWEEYIGQLVDTIDTDQETNMNHQMKLINSEMHQLKQGDIPYFTYNSTSKNLHANNKIAIKDFFENTGKNIVQKKNKELNCTDAAEVKNLLIAKYITWNQKPSDYRIAYPDKNQKNSPILLNDRILSVVKNISEIILSCANINKNHTARWISHDGDVTGLPAFHTASNFSFYNGYWGIIAFLVAAEKNLQNPYSSKITDFVDREIQIWLSDKRPSTFFSSAGLSGLAGNIKALSMIDNIRYKSAPVMLQAIYGDKSEIYKALDKKFDENEFIDIDYMAGKLGLVSVLRGISNDFVDNNILQDYLTKYHKDILKNWNNYISQRDKALIGFAHGISALINHLALCLSSNENADVISIDRLLSKVWEYDRSCKISESYTWADNRYLDIRPVNRSWCHGLPGIGISRLSLLNIDHYKKEALEDIRFILQTISKENKTAGFHHLCCGECGEIDFLIESSKISFFSPTSNELLNSRVLALLNQLESGHFFYGIVGKIDSFMAPDLYQGIAGIGYTLLRLKDNTLPLAY